MPHNDVRLATRYRCCRGGKLAWAAGTIAWTALTQATAASDLQHEHPEGWTRNSHFCVSLTRSDAIDPSKRFGRSSYAHPQFSLAAPPLRQLAGNCSAPNIFFCLALYWANGFP